MVTDYALTIENVIYSSKKGEPLSTTVMLTYWGGTIGSETQAIADVRLPVVGERLLLFLRPNWEREVSFTPVVGLNQGLFSVSPDVAGGGALVREAFGEPLRLAASGRVVRRLNGLAAAPAVSLETFISWLRANIKSIKAAPSEQSLTFDWNDPRLMKTFAKAPSLLTSSSDDRSIITTRGPVESTDAESSAGVPEPPWPSTKTLSGPGTTASNGNSLAPGYVTLGPKPNLPIVVNNFPDSFAPWSPEDEYQMSKWNYYASDVFRVYTTPTGTYGWPNGVFDLAGWPSSADLQSVYGSGWDSNTIGVTFSRSSGSTTIEADIALNPAFGFTLDDEWIFNGAGNVQGFRQVMIHELGHMHGLGHNFNYLAVMNYFPSLYRFFGLPYMDDAQGIRFLYPSRVVNRTDLGVYLYYESGYQNVSDATYPGSVVAGGSLSPNNYHVENVGTNTISTPTIEWYLTTARNYNSSYYYLGQATYPSLPSFTYFTPSTVQRTFTVPTTVSPGLYYLGAYIRNDVGSSQSGFPFNNNYAFSHTRIQVVAPSLLGPPTLVSPGTTTAPGSSVATLTPTFNWQPVSGADGYGLYVSRFNGSTYDLVFNSETDVGSPLTGTSFVLPNGRLQDGNQYRWNMSSHNSAGYGTPNVNRYYFYVSLPVQKPNLTPYQPSGWSDKIVVSKVTGTSTDGSPLNPTDTLYIDWAVINNGTANINSTFNEKLYVDGVEKQLFVTNPPLNTNSYTYYQDYSIGSLSAGTHTIKIVADSGSVITESNESDNEYTKTITVTASQNCYTLTANVSPNGGGNVTMNVAPNCSTGAGASEATLLSEEQAVIAADVRPSFSSGRGAAMKVSFDKLISKAEASGPISVIVGLNVPYQPEGMLSMLSSAIQEQRVSITKSQDQVLSELVSYEPASVKRYTFIPAMALKVDAANLRRLEASPNVSAIAEDLVLPLTLAESVPLIGAPAAWASGFTGSGKTVAILDTGVDKTHSFLSGKVVSEACYSGNLCPGGVTSSTSPGSGVNCNISISGCNHGTHVAGIAAGKGASFSGVAKDANIIAIQVFTQNSNGSLGASDSDIISGLQRVQALSSTFNIAAVNLSLGGGLFTSNCDSSNPMFKAAVDSLRSIGIATVIASGNDGSSNSISYPACISTAVSVGSTNDGSGGTVVNAISTFSNSASILKLLAPGSLINSSVPGGGFANFQGTSMATPHVVGAWAVLKSKSAAASVDQVLSALTSTGLAVTDSRNGITKPRIRVDAAVNALGGSVSGQYTSGTVVTLTPVPNSGYNFQSWSGCDSVSGNNCTVTMNASRSVTANFAASGSVLRIDTVTPAAGRVSGGQQIRLVGAFTGLSTVTMGGVAASWVYTNGSGDPSRITVTSPAHAVGAVQINLTPTSGSVYSKANAFAYLPTVFTDNTIFAAVTIARAQHIIELRQAVDAMRAVAGLAPAPWTDATLSPTSTIIKAVHILELRTYLNDAASRLGYSTSPYTDPTLTTGFLIKRVHIEELRQRIRVIAG